MSLPNLIEAARKDDLIAQQQLFEYHFERMLILSLSYVKVPEDAEEVVMTAYYNFFRNLPVFEYNGEGSIIAWLSKIVRNEALKHLRGVGKMHIVEEKYLNDVVTDDDLFDRLYDHEILGILLELPTGYRTVFTLYAVEGFDHKEIAELLGIDVGTSKSQLSRARTMLKNIITTKGMRHVKQ